MKIWLLLLPLLAGANANVLRPARITQCAAVRCAYGAVCEIDENGDPRCVCQMNCEGSISLPFCGEDGIQYDNMCEIEKKICEAQRMIDYMPGMCLGKFHHVTVFQPIKSRN